MPLTLANRITVVRILLVPVLIVLILYYQESVRDGSAVPMLRWAALALFLATVGTDAVDGYLARTRKEITRLGSLLDPVADKALLLSMLVLLSRPLSVGFPVILPVWFTVLVLSRDAVLVIGSALVYFTAGDIAIRPRFSGKAATFLQTAVILTVLMDLAAAIVTPLVVAAAGATGISAVQYLGDGLAQIDKNQRAVHS